MERNYFFVIKSWYSNQFYRDLPAMMSMGLKTTIMLIVVSNLIVIPTASVFFICSGLTFGQHQLTFKILYRLALVVWVASSLYTNEL